MTKQIMLEVRRNHAILLYESSKLQQLDEQIELSFTVVANDTGAIWMNHGDPKPEGFQDGTIFHISERMTKEGKPFKRYDRGRLRITILDDKKNRFYNMPN